MNHCFFTGRLVRDPEVRYGKEGNEFVTFDLAVTDNYKGEQSTSFFNFAAFGQSASIVAKMTKGQTVITQARANQKKYTDKDGKERTSIQFVAYEVHAAAWVDGNAAGKHEPKPAPPPRQAAARSRQEDDEVPF